MLSKSMIDALRQKYNANIANADTTINIYLKHPVAIGEHPQHLEEIDKLVGTIAENKDKLQVLEDFDG